MKMRIHFKNKTFKALAKRLQKAYDEANIQQIRHINALISLGKGMSFEDVAYFNQVSEQTVYNWIKGFLLRGFNSLYHKPPSGRKSKLTKTQKTALVKMIQDGPLANGYSTACWTSLLIQDLIFTNFNVRYNRHYICQLLHNLGFSYQKAKFVSGHLDKDKRETWLNKNWPEIYKFARQKNALLLFGDEASFALWGSLSYTWAPVGQQPEVKTSGIRKGYKVFGAIDFFTGKFFHQTVEGKFNAESYQKFLQLILKKTRKHVVLIQDNAPYHKSKLMNSFFEKNKNRISVHNLPSYSPDYNPIEFLWKKIKTRATHNRYFPAFEDLVSSVDSSLDFFSRHSSEIKNLMGLYLKTLDSLPAVA